MTQTRREFIKFVVAGSVTAGCPIDATLLAAPDSKAGGKPFVHGDHFEICHSIREGHHFARPDVTQKAAVIIIGGGVAGLSAAYFLRGEDFLLLEKEDHFGGNAYQEEYEGQPYATGSAFAWKDDEGDQLSRELGLKLLPVDNPDATIVNGTWVSDIWGSGIEKLPFPKEVRDSFRKFRDDIRKINVRERLMELDAEPFSKYTAGYAPEIAQWWDGFGPSNWGAVTAESSALLGVWGMHDLGENEKDPRVILPGGLGCITHKLVEVLQLKYKERMLSNATVVAIVPDKNEVRVTYMLCGRLVTVAAKSVVMCAPKMIASRLITALPPEQLQAMRRMRYAPYPVVNLIFEKPVYNRAYDTWCPGSVFTDMIVADWTVRNEPGYRQKNNILTFYTALHEEQRATLLTEEGCKQLAAHVLADFQKLLPEFNQNPIEVHVYSRGHPMYMAVPGQYTRNRIIAAHPLDRIYFGNADSGGPESMTSEAIRLSRVGAEWTKLILAGKPGAREQAEKALAVSQD